MPSTILGRGPAAARRTVRVVRDHPVCAVQPFGPIGPLRTDAQRTAAFHAALECAVRVERARRRR